MAESARAKRHIEAFRAHRSDRGVWDQHWDDLSRVMLVRRLGFATTTVPGESRTEDLFDGTPMRAATGLANAIAGYLRPFGERIAYIHTVDDADENSAEAKDWLADSEERLDEALRHPSARFSQATGECDLDLVVLGTAAMYVGEGRGLNNLLFQSIHLKDAYPSFDADGSPNGLYRCRELTVEQAVDEFGLGTVSNEVRRKYRDNKYGEKTQYLQCVIRRKEGRADAVMSKNFPYTDLWLDVKECQEVREGGFREFPFVVPRWDTSSGEDFGRSPGMIALPDANTLQAMGETFLVAGQRAADPPLAMPFDGFTSEANTFPGGLVYYDIETAQMMGRIPIQPIESGANLPITVEMQRDTREQVFAAFLKNVLNLPVNGPQMTAYEVAQRKEEFLREIGPVFGRLETDYTAPMIERSFNIMLRAGAFKPIPPALQGKSVRFEYESPVKRIRQQIEAAAADAWAANAIKAAAEAQRPDILDNINFDELLRFSHEANSLPHGVMRSRDDVAAKRKADAERMQQQKQMQAAQQVAEVANKAAPALTAINGGQAA